MRGWVESIIVIPAKAGTYEHLPLQMAANSVSMGPGFRRDDSDLATEPR
jgi:hypothetical protein